MSLSCIIISGMLWIGADDQMIQPMRIIKTPQSEIVTVWDFNDHVFYLNIDQQHQLRMGSEEFLSDCVLNGYTIPTENVPYDDIDDEEQEYIP